MCLGGEAQRLIDHRGAQVIPIEDADTFFQTIQRHVESIEEFSKPHPLSTEAAVASLKRYISEPRYRIQLVDLIDETVGKIIEVTSGEAFVLKGGPTPTSESTTARVRGYEAACSTLLAMAAVGGFWAEEKHHLVWQQTLERLGSTTLSSGTVLWLDLQRYPATLLLYTLGLGAVEVNQLHFLKCLLDATLRRKHQEDMLAVQILPPFRLFNNGGQAMRILEGMDDRYAPLNDWIHDTLRPYAERIIPNNDRYTLVFDKLEILMALSYAHHQGKRDDRYWAPPGAFVYRGENQTRILQEIRKSLSTRKDESSFVTCGIFGESAEACERGLTTLEGFVSRFAWR